MTLLAARVESDEEVQALRVIRNACAGTFSHDNSDISELRQRAWWVAMRGLVRAWLFFLPEEEGAVVGYGLVRQVPGGAWWNSIAVLPGWRGRHYGAEITHYVLQHHPWPVYAAVLESNAAARRMHALDEWDDVGTTNGLVTLVSRSSAHETSRELQEAIRD